MFRRKDDAAFDSRLLHAGQHLGEVDDELRGGVGDDRLIRLVALSVRIVEFEVDPELFHFCHRPDCCLCKNTD